MDDRAFLPGGALEFQMPADLGGDGEELFVLGFDVRKGVYTFDAFSSQGLHQISKGACSDDTWTWTSDGFQGGRPLQQKMTIGILARTRYTLAFEVSRDGTWWLPFMQGKARKK